MKNATFELSEVHRPVAAPQGGAGLQRIMPSRDSAAAQAKSLQDRMRVKMPVALKSLLLLTVVVAFGVKPVQRLVATTSAEAVMNAPLTTIRAPIEGRLSESLGRMRVGTMVDAHDDVLAISNERSDTQSLDALRRTERELQTQYAGLDLKLAVLRQARKTLAEQKERFRAARVQQLQQRIAELDRDIEGAKANHLSTVEALARSQQLRQTGNTPMANFERATRDERVALEAHAGLLERRKGMLVELDAARAGTFVGDSYNDTPQSVQRALEVDLEIADSEGRLNGLRSHLDLIEADIETALQRFRARSTAVVKAKSKGRVWEVMTSDGEHVNAGQELLRVVECGSAFVTASVSETAYQRLRVGQPATFKPRGGWTEYVGRVVSLNSFVALKTNMAIPEAMLTREPYHVVLEFPDIQTSDNCDVGRSGLVTFNTEADMPVASLAAAPADEAGSVQ